MNMLVAAIRAKNKSNSTAGLILRPQYPQYVLYDSEGDEIDCNLKMSYGSSRTGLTEHANPNRGFWRNRTKMEKNLIFLISTLFLVTLGLMVAVTFFAHKSQENKVLNSVLRPSTAVPLIKSTVINSETKTTHSSVVNTNQTETSGNTNETNTSPNPITSSESHETNASAITPAVDVNDSSSPAPIPPSKAQMFYSPNNHIIRKLSALKSQPVISDTILNDSYDNNIENSTDVCMTDACKTAGDLIKKAINESVDPCDDFYEFACGGWESSHTIPKDKSRYGNFDALDEKLQNSLKEELQKTSVKSDAFSVVYAADLYKACTDSPTIESRGVQPLVDSLNSIGGWPLIGNSSVYTESKYDWSETLAKVIARFGSSVIFSVSIQPDSNETLVNRLYFDAPSFGLGRNQLVNRSEYPDIVNAYKTFITKTAILLGAKNDSQTHKDVNDLLDFESKLANFSTPPEDRRDASVWYNRMTIKDFNELTSKRVDWVNVTNRVYSILNSKIRLSSDELVIVEDIPYYKSVTELLETTPKRIIANYFGWMSVMSFGDYTVKKFRDIEFEFNKVNSGVEEESPLWQICVNYLETALQYAVSRLYVDNNFTKKDKTEATVMVKDIQESFRELIGVSDWLDGITKNKSLHKLNAIIENVGYPEWILDNTQLDAYYSLTKKVDPKKSFESLLYVQNNNALNSFEDIRKPVNRTLDWPMPPAIVNAAYEPTQNSITIPAGILKSPFFDSQRPSYMNYGAIGLVVGHEMTHGFDDEGSQFDENGDLINWWSDEIRKRFNKKSDCFVNEYSSYYDNEAKMHLNGKNTVGENIADNGGLRESYRAYELYVEKHGPQQRLPFVTQYTPEQLFFLSYANTWCSLIRPEALKTLIQYNPHSPAKYRVNVPFTNFKSFSDVYKCGSTSKMNPKNKCVLW